MRGRAVSRRRSRSPRASWRSGPGEAVKPWRGTTALPVMRGSRCTTQLDVSVHALSRPCRRLDPAGPGHRSGRAKERAARLAARFGRSVIRAADVGNRVAAPPPSCKRASSTCRRPAIIQPTPRETIRIGPVTVASHLWGRTSHSCCQPQVDRGPRFGSYRQGRYTLPLTAAQRGSGKDGQVRREPPKCRRAYVVEDGAGHCLCTNSAYAASGRAPAGCAASGTSAATRSVP